MANIGHMQSYIAVLTRDTSLLSDAVHSFEEALSIQQRVSPPADQARTAMGQAAALARIGAWTQRHRYQTEALEVYDLVLSLAPKEVSPFQWSEAQQDIGLIVARIGKSRNDPEQLQQAVDIFRQLLQVGALSQDPAKWIKAHLNLASTLVLLANASTSEQRESLLIEATQILAIAEEHISQGTAKQSHLDRNIRATRSLLRKISLR